MPDEYYLRYQGLSHRDLYAMLAAGDPDAVDDLGSRWKSLQDAADHLATMLARDLERLGHAWDSASGREYTRRVGLVASYAQTLAGELGRTKDGLTLMSGSLREAKRRAENPADATVGDAAAGVAVGMLAGPPGALADGVIGGFLGHDQDLREQEKAHQRMILLVAGLAADYAVTARQTWPNPVALAPPDLPDAPAVPFQPDGARGGVPGAGGGQSTVDSALLGTDGPVGADGADGPGGIPRPTTGAAPGQSGLAGSAGPTGVASAGGGIVGGVLGGRHDRDERDDRSVMAGGRAPRGGRGGDDEPDERTTWLTEDEMVWGGDEDAAPPVLGAEPADDDSRSLGVGRPRAV